MSETELSVICKNCGSEASPYITECPYCGTRLRKRAPKLERGDGGSLEAKPPRERMRKLLRWRLPRPAWLGEGTERPYATGAAIVAPAVLLLVQRAADFSLLQVGALEAPLSGGEWWRLLSSPFVYQDVGYLFAIGLALAIFGTGLERRLGSVATALLLVACGSLGMLAASGVAGLGDEVVLVAGGNGAALGAVAAWFMLRRREASGAIDEDYDPIGVAVAAAVLLLLPVFESNADVFAGLAGGLVGGLAGFAASALRPSH